ncbi:hypothetical protein BJ170DRAFT_596643 [Xylariales sp. AK1849]|nr:hypothetical protein BJ170DRAFT_596643 [Xylariales sp. AK1849]
MTPWISEPVDRTDPRARGPKLASGRTIIYCIEEKLNSLVDLLKASNSGELPAGLRNPPSIAEDTSCFPSETEPVPSDQYRTSVTSSGSTPTPASSDEPIGVVPPTYNSCAPPTCICRAPIGEAPVPVESDEALLSMFVTKLSPRYPFVVVRPGISAQELESTSPVLFSAIRMVSSVRHLKSMMAQNYALMDHVAEQMLLQSRRSIELLQTLLLMLGYYHYHCMMHAQMSNLAALACSLAADLGINRCPELQERTRVLMLNPPPPSPRTNDERRALCGMWYINSVISTTFQRLQTPRYTPYIDQCLRELETAKEYESDLLLVQLVRIQHLADRISQLHSRDRMDDELPGIPRAPVTAYLNAFQTELDRFKAQIPRHLRKNLLLINHFNTAVLRLWEPPIVDARLLENLSESFTSLSLRSPTTLDVFYRSHAALKSWFESWLSVDITDYFYLPMPASAQLITAITMLSRWAKLGAGGTDPSPNSSGDASNTAAVIDPSTYQIPISLASVPTNPEPEPAVALAIAKIKAQIRSQPDLQLDIVGILRALVTRFEEARAEVSMVQGGVWENNIWDLAARKISITKLKLERWAEIVSTVGAEGLLSRGYEPADSSVEGAGFIRHSIGIRSGPMDGVERSENLELPPGQDAWQYNNMFAHDLFDGLGLDQNFFFDDGGDYGTAVLNNFSYQGPTI